MNWWTIEEESSLKWEWRGEDGEKGDNLGYELEKGKTEAHCGLSHWLL